ncbi:MAG: hypothetical protein IPP90_13565 [Gemmatimonadaceae bacterium]|nr:hypothetical protein [Gemmatimonadaceae bacterium]
MMTARVWRPFSPSRVARITGCGLALGSTACFPTFHNARIDPGFRLDAGATTIRDQPRDNQPQPPDYLATVSPAVGFGHRLEVGVPIGVYMANGLRRQQGVYTERGMVVMPYAKLALLDATSRDHLAVFVQTSALIIPSIAGIRYGRDYGTWEPHAGLTVIQSGGPSGDDPVITRYQQLHQSLITLSVGATWMVAGYPGVEMGVLRNAYDENRFTAQGTLEPTRHTLYDIFVGLRVSTGTLKQQAKRQAERHP